MVTELVIFDCDGVLVDSERISLTIQAQRLRDLGLQMTFEDCVREFLGIGMPATLRAVEERLGRPLPATWERELADEVHAAFGRDLEAVAGIESALDSLDVATCVASSGSHEKMRLTLGVTDLYARFDGRIFSADEVPSGKPAPDLFLHAAAKMGVAPERCVVVEDSPAGIAAATAAGMRSLGYAETTPPERLAGADAIFADMDDLPALVHSVTP